MHRFRLSLWAEHTHTDDPTFVYPNTIECARKVTCKVSFKDKSSLTDTVDENDWRGKLEHIFRTPAIRYAVSSHELSGYHLSNWRSCRATTNTCGCTNCVNLGFFNHDDARCIDGISLIVSGRIRNIHSSNCVACKEFVKEWTIASSIDAYSSMRSKFCILSEKSSLVVRRIIPAIASATT